MSYYGLYDINDIFVFPCPYNIFIDTCNYHKNYNLAAELYLHCKLVLTNRCATVLTIQKLNLLRIKNCAQIWTCLINL